MGCTVGEKRRSGLVGIGIASYVLRRSGAMIAKFIVMIVVGVQERIIVYGESEKWKLCSTGARHGSSPSHRTGGIMKEFLALLILAVGITVPLLYTVYEQKNDIVKLQLDRDEIKVHTDMLAQIVKTQQYQIDTLTESIIK